MFQKKYNVKPKELLEMKNVNMRQNYLIGKENITAKIR